VKLLSQALDWLAFVDVAPSSLDLIVRFVAVVNEQTKQGNIADKVLTQELSRGVSKRNLVRGYFYR